MNNKHRISKWSETFTIEDGRIIRTVYAYWKTKKSEGREPVYRINDEGKEEVRCLFYCPVSGYLVNDDGEEWDWGEPWINVNSIRSGMKMEKVWIEEILKLYPDFKYTLEKAGKVNSKQVMQLLITWKKNPKVEFLVALKLDNLTYNKSFLKMGKDKQKAILRFVKMNPDAAEWHLNKIFFAMKKGTAADYDKWQDFRNDQGKVVNFKWWKKYGSDRKLRHFYEDYLHMAKLCGHDTKDPYWEYPKDIMAAHDKVEAEYRRKLEAERLAQKKQQRKEDRERKKKFLATVRKLEDCHTKARKFTAFIPQDIDSVKRQAEFLHQCLITNGYIEDIANRDCVLVFITDDNGNPAATAEILPNGKIGQFYANQGIGENKDPTEDQQKILDKWMNKFKDKAVELMKKKKAA